MLVKVERDVLRAAPGLLSMLFLTEKRHVFRISRFRVYDQTLSARGRGKAIEVQQQSRVFSMSRRALRLQ